MKGVHQQTQVLLFLLLDSVEVSVDPAESVRETDNNEGRGAARREETGER
jgi:hypothetical protein